MAVRLKIFAYTLIIIFIALLARLFYWQVIKGDGLAQQARGQYEGGLSIDAKRGSILASDGTWLASSGEAYQMYASLPDLTYSPDKIAELLAPFTVNEPGEYEILSESKRINKILTRDEIVWPPIASRLSPEKKRTIEEMNLEGIGFIQEERRIYPEASASAHLLGFVGKSENGDDKGYFGLEGFYDLVLQGKEGFLLREKDAKGLPIILGSSKEASSISGIDIVTNIDKTLQLRLEEKLKKGIERYGAVAGSAIIMDPKSGAILAMSSYPSYDPNKYSKYSTELFKNPVISDSFEPGSVFKVVVMAAALRGEVGEPDTICDACSGPVVIDKYTIETWNQQYFPDSSMVDVIVHSDNVGMVFVARKLGINKLFDYIKKFGFGEVTGIDLQGEASPKIREETNWGIVDLATAGFGQGIAVTPIQLVAAVSAIANDGVYVSPQVVDKFAAGGKYQEIESKTVGRVISEEAADEITGMMVEAAKRGEAKWTYERGFGVAGKTGTAQIPIAGHYDEDKTIASFVGFAPHNNPKFVMLVTLREPTTS